MSEGYNGWTNYETWVVNLWMDNEQGSQEFFRERAREIYDGPRNPYRDHMTREADAGLAFADWLRDHYDENIPEMPGVYGDLLGGALGAVNWNEIARHYIDAVLEEVTDANG
jgi:hypothetical protein